MTLRLRPVCISTDTVYKKAFYADKKNYSVLLKAEFDINGTNSLRAGNTCPISFVARGKVRQPSHLVPGHGGQVRYSPSTKV